MSFDRSPYQTKSGGVFGRNGVTSSNSVAVRFRLVDIDWIGLQHRRRLLGDQINERELSFCSGVPAATLAFRIDATVNDDDSETKTKSARSLMELSVRAACDALELRGPLPSGTPRFGDSNPNLAALREGSWEFDRESQELVAQLQGRF